MQAMHTFYLPNTDFILSNKLPIFGKKEIIIQVCYKEENGNDSNNLLKDKVTMKISASKSVIQKSPFPDYHVFTSREIKDKHFDPTWHAHQEYQLFYVLKGTGTRFIGDTVKHFEKGDLTFLGPNIPHLWRSDEPYFDVHSNEHIHGLVIYFTAESLSSLIEKEEMRLVKTLLEKLKYGLEIYGDTAQKIKRLMIKTVQKIGIESLIEFFRIMAILSTTKEYRLIHEQIYDYQLKDMETNRINLVVNYAAKHFRNKIELHEVASLLNMTPTSFSRYFTMKTSKSFSHFLSEIRIRHACKLLTSEEDKSIAQICYDSGFNTLSNFNKQFRLRMGMTPKDYRNNFKTF